MCQGTVHTFVNALFSVSFLSDRNTHTIHLFHIIYPHKMLPIILFKEIIKFEKEFKASKNLIEEIENRQASFGACRFFGRGDRARTCDIQFPNGPMKAISAKNSFFRPFPLGKPRSSALLSPLFPSAPKR